MRFLHTGPILGIDPGTENHLLYLLKVVGVLFVAASTYCNVYKLTYAHRFRFIAVVSKHLSQ